MEDVPGATALRLRQERQQRSTVGGKCNNEGQMSKEMRKLFSLVKDARNTARKQTKSAASFMSVLKNPQEVLFSTQTLLRELKRVLNNVKRPEDTEEVVRISQKFKLWYDTVRTAVSRMKSIDTQPAEFWLRIVYLNLTEQREAFERLRTGICNASGYDRDNTKFADLIDSMTRRFGREMAQLQANWNTNRDLLTNVSRAVLNLDSAMAATKETTSEIQKSRTSLEVMKTVNKRFKRLSQFLTVHTQHPRELHEFLAARIGGNWIEAMEKSGYSGFLRTLSSSKKQILVEIMHKLWDSVVDLKKATKRLPTRIYEMISGDLTYVDSNGTGSSPTMSLVDKLEASLRILMKKGQPISNEKFFVDRLVRQMEEAS